MRLWAGMTLMGCLALSSRAAEKTLAEYGVARYAVAVDDDATPAEKNAAAELRHYMALLSGVGPQAGGAPHTLHVGPGRAARRLAPDIDWDNLAPDEIVLRTVGDDVVIAGGRPRGTLYAVYELLERVWGVRWWTSAAEYVPRVETLVLPPLDIRYAPPFQVREAFFQDPAKHPRFAVRMRQNGHHTHAGPEWGGRVAPVGFVHTMVRLLVTKDAWFDAHPEYFALVDGKRQPTQLCLSNPGVRRLLAEKTLERLRAEAHPVSISVSQEDNESHCRCPDCADFDAKEASPAGLMVAAVNDVADAVAAEFPGVWVETLAYQYTRRAPKTVRPRDNVVVRLCSIECDFSKPLNAPENADFHRDLKEWSALARHLAVWDYVGNYANRLIPHENFSVFAPNLRLFARHNVMNVLAQGDSGLEGELGDLVELKTWLLSQLLWDPERDADALTREFLAGYYGAAAPHVDAYLRARREALAASGRKLGCYTPAAYFLDGKALAACSAAMDAALDAVADDDARTERVRRARVSLDFALIMNYQAASREPGFRPANYPAPDLARFADETLAFALAHGTVKVRHDAALADWADNFRALAASTPLPARFRPQRPFEVFDVQESALVLEDGAGAAFVDDVKASNKRALRLDASRKGWAARQGWSRLMVAEPGKWRMFVSVRGRPGKDAVNGGALIAGSRYNGGAESYGVVSVKELRERPGEYRLFDFGVHSFGFHSTLWIAATGNAGKAELFVDRVILVREGDGPTSGDGKNHA